MKTHVAKRLMTRRMLLPALALVAVVLVAVTLVSPRPELTAATGSHSITSPDTVGDVGQWTSLALDGSGNPVVSYYAVIGDLKVLHCNDPNCDGGGESIRRPDIGGDVGQYTSLELDASGNPVVSYYHLTNGNLKVLHCGDVNCASGNSITSPDTGGDVGKYTSLELDAFGNPIVSYYDATGDDLKVMRCNDPNCAGDDEVITSLDTEGDVGQYTSLALDTVLLIDFPVVSYYDATNDNLKVLHCIDPFCAGGGDSITSPDTAGDVGKWTSLELDASGNPVVSYYDVTNGNPKVMHCNDPNCAGGNESITSPDTGLWVGQYTSLALDGSGNPVVSYFDFNNVGLKVLHCNDPNCAGGDESTTVPDRGSIPYVRGGYTSLALDGSGNPVVSYYDFGFGNLKVLHCGDATCSGPEPPPTPGVGGIAELPLLAGTLAEESGVPAADARWPVGTYAGLAAGVAAAVLALGGAAWYARRRWLR